MTRNEIAGDAAMFVGSTACTSSAAASFFNESTMLLILSVIGAMVAVCGLVYNVWNGNRQYKLQRQQYIDEKNERRQVLGLPPLDEGEGA